MRTASRGGLLRDRDFRYFFVGHSSSRFGDSLAPLALAFAVLHVSGSPAALGLVLAASRLPMVLFALLGGAIGDRYPRRRVMIATDVLRFGCHGLTAALLLTGQAGVIHLAVLQALAGLGAAFFEPSARALVADLVATDELAEANSLLGLTHSLAQISGLGLAGVVVALVGPGAVFLVNAASYVLSVACLSLLSSPAVDLGAATTSLGKQMLAGALAVRHRAWLSLSIVHMALLNALVVAPFLVLGPYVAEEHLGGAGAWATLGVAGAVGGIAGNLVAMRIQPRRPLMAALLWVFAVVPLVALLAVPAALWLLVPAAFLGMAQGAVYNVIHTSLVQAHVPRETLGSVASLILVGNLAATPLGMAVAGPAAELLGWRAVLVFASVWAVVSTAAVLSSRRVREVPGAPAGEQRTGPRAGLDTRRLGTRRRGA